MSFSDLSSNATRRPQDLPIINTSEVVQESETAPKVPFVPAGFIGIWVTRFITARTTVRKAISLFTNNIYFTTAYILSIVGIYNYLRFYYKDQLVSYGFQLSYAAMMHLYLGEFESAVVATNEACEISQGIGNVWGETFSQSWIGEAHLELGHVEQAIAAMEHAIRLAAHSFQPPLSYTHAGLALIYGEMGQVAHAIELARVAQAAGERLAPVMHVVTSRRSRLHLLEGDLLSAGALLDQAARLLGPIEGASPYHTMLFLTQAELALARQATPGRFKSATG